MVAVRVLLCVLLHRHCDATIRVAFTKHRVDCTAEHLGVASSDLHLLLRGGLCWEVWHREAVGLQLLDGGKKLRHGCRNVRQLDNVGSWMLRKLPQLCEVVLHPLRRSEVIRESGQDPCRERDVLLHDLDAREAAVGAHHRQERVGRQHGCLIGVRIHDLDIWDLEANVLAKLVGLLQHAQLRAGRHVVKPLCQLYCAILVQVQACKKLGDLHIASGQVEVLQCLLQLAGIEGARTIAVIALESLRENC
mmetsp:Transcript_13450/g.32089  ORF Transcript_13450/g.32089 Transcript_13450/m.32089 type:complete len:249 (-) Transcript_13450:235-981(-)